MTLVVRGGTVVTQAGPRPADLVVGRDGRVAAIERAGTAAGDEVIDADGLWVLPGMIDAHVHFQEPGRSAWEGFDTGSAAAAAGGVTTVVDMPIDCDPPTLTALDIAAKVDAASRRSRVDFALWGGLVPSSRGALDEMAAAGVSGFKAFACPSGWDDFPAADAATLNAGFAAGARLGLPVAVHCELAPLGHTVESEVEAVRWAAGLAAGAGARLHVVHVSSAAAVDEALRWDGVTVETCMHYLDLDEGVARCHPPIRDSAARAALWARVVGGAVNCLASDHSPCPLAEHPHWAGVDGVGMTLPLALDSGRLDVAQVARLTTEAARILGLAGKGSLAPGMDADAALVDPTSSWVVGPGTQWSRLRQSPFAGRTVRCRVVRTLVRGKTVYSVDDGPAERGSGRLVRPAPVTVRSGDRRLPAAGRRSC